MTIVRPKVRLESLSEASLLLGVFVGTAISLSPIIRNIHQNGFVYVGGLFSSVALIELSCMFVFGAVLSRFVPRTLQVFLASISCAFGSLLVLFVTLQGAMLGRTPDALASLALAIPLSLLTAPVIALAGLLPFGLSRAFGFDVTEQDGTLCWNCGYKSSQCPAARCPECGRSDPNRKPAQTTLGRICGFVGRRMRTITLVLLIPCCVIVIIRALSTDASRLRFQRASLLSLGTFARMQMLGETYYQDGEAWTCDACIHPLPEDQTKAIVILYAPECRSPQPIMQIRLMWTSAVPKGFPITGFDGLPAVLCNLDSDQAARVLESGVPKSLSDALVNAASNAGWPKQRPQPNKAGIITQVDPGKGPSRIVVVNGDSFFIKAESGKAAVD